MQAQASRGELPPFEFHEVNAMRLATPHQVRATAKLHRTDKPLSWEAGYCLQLYLDFGVMRMAWLACLQSIATL